MQVWGTRGNFVRLCGLAILCLLVAVAQGCGAGDSSGASADDSSNSPIPDSPPKLKPPGFLPPKKLVVKELREGTGAEAKLGDEVKLQYYGILWGGGMHSNSWGYPSPPVFKLSKPHDPRLLRGLNLAVPGMKEGGSREVLIPHNLVYYPGVVHARLGTLDALRYRVYLVDVLPPPKPSKSKSKP